MNGLGQLLYLDYEINDLKNRNSIDSLSKAINKKQTLIEVIEKVENPSLKRSLNRFYIEKVANEFIVDSLRKLKSRNLPKILCCNEQDVKNTEIAKKQIHMVLNHQIVLTDEELEMVISNLDDSLDRIIFRKFLIDKKNNAQIAREIGANTFRRESSTTNGKSTFNRSTVGRRINKFK
ncbi:hypothetical protein [Lysinibacillus sp. OTC-L20]|uniref:hypothetical protein n=1 Tax=Lysinibacillus sp. OTC-L20 TaxID=3342791 RepID=UPI0035B85FFE